jgi:hypothetical protein
MDHHKAAVHTTQPTQIILPTPTTDLAAAAATAATHHHHHHLEIVKQRPTHQIRSILINHKYNILPTCRHQLCNWTFSFQNSLH